MGFYYGILQDITDITGLFIKDLLTLDQNPEKAPWTLIFEESKENSAQFISEYYGILRNITVRNISPALNSGSPGYLILFHDPSANFLFHFGVSF